MATSTSLDQPAGTPGRRGAGTTTPVQQMARKPSLPLPALLTAALLAALREVDSLFDQLQQEGSTSYRIEALGGGLLPGEVVETARSAVALWRGVDAEAATLFVRAYTAVDSLFALAYGALLALFLSRCAWSHDRYPWRRSIDRWYREPLWPIRWPRRPGEPRRRQTAVERDRAVAGSELGEPLLLQRFRPLPALVAADLAENAARWLAFELAGADGGPPAAAIWFAYAAEKAKFVLAALVLLTVYYAVLDLLTEPADGAHGQPTPAPEGDAGGDTAPVDASWHPLQGVRLRPAAASALGRAVRAVAVLRGQLALAVVFSLLLLVDLTGQVGDILRRWVDRDASSWAAAALGILAVGLLAYVLWSSCRRIILANSSDSLYRSRARESSTGLLLTFPAALVLAGLAHFLLGWTLLLGLPIVLAILVALEGVRLLLGDGPAAESARRAEDSTAESRRPPRAEFRWTYQRAARWLAVLPPAVLGIAVVRAGVGPLVLSLHAADGYQTGAALLLLGIGLALLTLVALAFLPLLRRWDGATGVVRDLEVRHVATILVVAAVTVALVFAPLQVPPAIGTVATVAVALAAVGLLTAELARFSELTAPPLGLTLLSFRRVPVFLVLGAWFAISSALDDGSYHTVRHTDVAPPAALGLREAWSQWSQANCLDRAGAPVPLVVAAAEGGGIRAAYWTASVLSDLLPEDPAADCPAASSRSRVFAVSGISGGSVGAVAYLSNPSAARDWFEPALGAPDFAATPLATGLLVDLPRALVGFQAPDRAAWLERAWEQEVPGMSGDYFTTLRPGTGTGSWLPVTLLNGAQVETGCRVNTSAVRLTADPDVGCRSLAGRESSVDLGGTPPLRVPAAPVTVDVIAHVGPAACGASFAASTAALLSARWPYISPSGQLPCPDPRVSVVDGGYADGSGAAAAGDLWAQLEPLVARHNAAAGAARRLVVPVFVRVDNHYTAQARPRPPARTGELLVPPVTKLRANGTVDVDRKQRTAAMVSSGLPGRPGASCAVPGLPRNGEYLLAPTTRPGLPAPLAWTLAGPSRRDLDDQRADLFAPGRPGSQLRDLLTGAATIACTG